MRYKTLLFCTIPAGKNINYSGQPSVKNKGRCNGFKIQYPGVKLFTAEPIALDSKRYDNINT